MRQSCSSGNPRERFLASRAVVPVEVFIAVGVVVLFAADEVVTSILLTAAGVVATDLLAAVAAVATVVVEAILCAVTEEFSTRSLSMLSGNTVPLEA